MFSRINSTSNAPGALTPWDTCQQRGCAFAAAYPDMAPASHECKGQRRVTTFPEFGFYTLHDRIMTMGMHNKGYEYAIDSKPWHSAAQRLAFLLGATNTINALKTYHYKFIQDLREAVDWADPADNYNRPHFMHTRGIEAVGNGNNGFRAYRFQRDNGEILLTVDDWDGGGGTVKVQTEAGVVDVSIAPASGNSGKMCVVKVDTSGNQEQHCCTVTPISGGTEEIVCP